MGKECSGREAVQAAADNQNRDMRAHAFLLCLGHDRSAPGKARLQMEAYYFD
jgi:hypothetical protein